MPESGPDERLLRVLIADDHPIFLAGMQLTLESYPGLRCVAAVTTGAQAVRVALAERPDVAVLDINMPDLSGVVVARAIAADAPGVGLLMLTMLDDDESVFAALRAGARGYLLKGSTPDEVVAAIRGVAASGAIFGPSIAARIVDYFTAGPAVSRGEAARRGGGVARAVRARAAGTDVPRRRRVESGDRRTAQSEPEDRAQSCVDHSRQTARRRSTPGDAARPRRWPRLTPCGVSRGPVHRLPVAAALRRERASTLAASSRMRPVTMNLTPEL
nr:hypothetical protein GCM10020092_078030 [Actinoplanes digitatis]